MKKLSLLIVTSIFSVGVWASPNCEKLAQLAESSASNYGDDATAIIQGKKGSRAYFYTAPSNQCKTTTFVIPKDRITLMQDIKSEGETWVYVAFSGGEVPTLTHGWMKKSNIGEVTFN